MEMKIVETNRHSHDSPPHQIIGEIVSSEGTLTIEAWVEEDVYTAINAEFVTNGSAKIDLATIDLSNASVRKGRW